MIKKFTQLWRYLVFAFLFILLSAYHQTAFSQTATAPTLGDGSPGAPYQIATLENLYWLATTFNTNLSKHYLQTADIDAATTTSWTTTGGTGWMGIATYSDFIGTYDGGGYSIRNLYTMKTSFMNVGLFGTIGSGGVVKNLRLVNTRMTGFLRAGALAAEAEGAIISNVISEGGTVSAGSNVGGLIGQTNSAATITNCYSSTTVSGSGSSKGGLSGNLLGSSLILNSYSIGKVNGTGGGLVGTISSSTVTNSYYDSQTSGKSDTGKGEPKTTAEMKTQATFTGWDFTAGTGDWNINPTGYISYPYLQAFTYDVPEASPAVNPIPGLEASTAQVNEIWTDYNGYWNSSSASINPIQPDNSHNLLAFRYGGTVYSTGVNDAQLNSNSISYTSGNWRAFPISNLPTSGPASYFVGLGQLYDGIDNGVDDGNTNPFPANPSSEVLSSFLTDGINGLDLGTGLANIPAGQTLTFNLSSNGLTSSSIADGIPDILFAQIASPGSGGDKIRFVDAAGTTVGVEQTFDLSSLTNFPVVGNWKADFYKLNSTGELINTIRSISFFAAEISSFGITSSNYQDVAALKYTTGGNADPAFVAFSEPSISVATNLEITGKPSTYYAGAPMTPTNFTVVVKDSQGTTIPQAGTQITASITSGSGTLSGTLTATTDINGIATFNNLILTGTGSHQIQFSASSLDPDVATVNDCLATGNLTIGITASGAAYSIENGLLLAQGTATIAVADIINHLQNVGNLAINVCGGDLTIAADILPSLTAGSRTLALKASGNIIMNAGKSISASADKLNLLLWADSDNNKTGSIFINQNSIVTSGGHLWIGGGAQSSSPWNGLIVGSGSAYADAVHTWMIGTITFNFKNGISILKSSINTSGGNINVFGIADGVSGAPNGYNGVYMEQSILSSESGDIVVEAKSTRTDNDGSWHYGLLMGTIQDNSSSIIESTGGSITILAETDFSEQVNGAGVGLYSFGNSNTQVLIRSVAGNINITGRLNSTGYNNQYGGIFLFGDGIEQIVSTTGNINLEGTSANPNVAGINQSPGNSTSAIGFNGVNPFSGDITFNSNTFINYSGIITANTLNLLGSGIVYDFSNPGNNVGTLTANTGKVSYLDSNELTLGAITASNDIKIATENGNLTLIGNLSTTSTSADAIILNAGKSAAIGTSTGGDIKVSGTPTITTGTGGISKLFSGSETESTGLSTLAGGSTNVRFGVDETTVTFDPVLAGNNAYALYRVFNVFIWAGTNNEDGTTNGNWNTGAVPPTGSDIVIPTSAPRFPVFDQDLELGNVTIEANAQLTMAPGKGLKISSGKNVTIASSGKIVLKSNADGTAYIETLAGGSAITGTVVQERHLMGSNRSFRFMSHPFKTAIPLSALGDKIDITGTGTGFTPTATNDPSAFYYDPSAGDADSQNDGGWKAFTAMTDNWNPYQGIRVLVRGPKGQANSLLDLEYTPDPVTFEWEGEVNTGLQTIPLAYHTPSSGVSDFNLIGNPFPAPIDLKAIGRSASVGANFFIWQPRVSSSGASGRGGSYLTEPFATGTATYTLPTGGAFFVNAGAAGQTLTIEETHKVNYNEPLQSVTGSTLRMEEELPSKYGQNSLQLLLSSEGEWWDRSLLFFDQTTTNTSVDKQEATKLANPEVNFFTVSDDDYAMAIDVRPYQEAEAGKTQQNRIPLHIQSPARAYTLTLPDFHLEEGRTLRLYDRFTEKYITLAKGLSYDFNVTADPKSKGHRFDLVMGVEVITSLETVNNRFQVFLLPNPAQEQVRISIQRPDNLAETTFRIVSMTGVVVRNEKIAADTTELDINLTELSKGIYLVEITHGTERIVKRLIVK